ncbi:hypothetical protein SteCoe_24931 [Stentor coeruleus]|uniref:HSA domain-containing protein n=1 Tax=Stentor coeruleus TaxID=5963 RepID=A0A1R2BGG5_9CILI|nr:hypothetical protein SteCoe_24931 [Stentor coeruleus]
MEELIEQRYQILQRTSQQRERIGGRRMPRIREPKREYTHWDYFLEEMKWLATDFIEDRKHKQALAYVITNEIRHKKITAEKKEAKKNTKCRKQAKIISDLVMKYYFSIDDGKRYNEKDSVNQEKFWRVSEVVNNPPAFNIILENSRAKKDIKVNTNKPIYKYALNVVHTLGYSTCDKIEELLNKEPSTPETGINENDVEPLEHLTNFQLFYDAENIEKELNLQLEDLHLEDLDVYRPLTSDCIEFRDITHEEALFEEELFELVPDSEEYMLWENTKNCLEVKDPEPFHNPDLAQVCKRDWKIFEDHLLEQNVCEFGGNWEFISDLLSTNPLCSFNFVTPEECFNRWAFLQKRKGRSIPGPFRPAQVFQNEFPPVQCIPSNFSINKRKNEKIHVFPKSITFVPLESEQTAFNFYLTHNIRPENNTYFSNYKVINSRHYQDITFTGIPPSSKNGSSITKNPPQPIIDKEEENNFKILELIDQNKQDNDKPPKSPAPVLPKKSK